VCLWGTGVEEGTAGRNSIKKAAHHAGPHCDLEMDNSDSGPVFP
jgi:hypothetical protein